MGQRESNAAKKNAQIMLRKEECAKGMEVRPSEQLKLLHKTISTRRKIH